MTDNDSGLTLCWEQIGDFPCRAIKSFWLPSGKIVVLNSNQMIICDVTSCSALRQKTVFSSIASVKVLLESSVINGFYKNRAYSIENISIRAKFGFSFNVPTTVSDYNSLGFRIAAANCNENTNLFCSGAFLSDIQSQITSHSNIAIVGLIDGHSMMFGFSDGAFDENIYPLASPTEMLYLSSMDALVLMPSFENPHIKLSSPRTDSPDFTFVESWAILNEYYSIAPAKRSPKVSEAFEYLTSEVERGYSLHSKSTVLSLSKFLAFDIGRLERPFVTVSPNRLVLIDPINHAQSISRTQIEEVENKEVNIDSAIHDKDAEMQMSLIAVSFGSCIALFTCHTSNSRFHAQEKIDARIGELVETALSRLRSTFAANPNANIDEYMDTNEDNFQVQSTPKKRGRTPKKVDEMSATVQSQKTPRKSKKKDIVNDPIDIDSNEVISTPAVTPKKRTYTKKKSTLNISEDANNRDVATTPAPPSTVKRRGRPSRSQAVSETPHADITSLEEERNSSVVAEAPSTKRSYRRKSETAVAHAPLANLEDTENGDETITSNIVTPLSVTSTPKKRGRPKKSQQVVSEKPSVKDGGDVQVEETIGKDHNSIDLVEEQPTQTEYPIGNDAPAAVSLNEISSTLDEVTNGVDVVMDGVNESSYVAAERQDSNMDIDERQQHSNEKFYLDPIIDVLCVLRLPQEISSTSNINIVSVSDISSYPEQEEYDLSNAEERHTKGYTFSVSAGMTNGATYAWQVSSYLYYETDPTVLTLRAGLSLVSVVASDIRWMKKGYSTPRWVIDVKSPLDVTFLTPVQFNSAESSEKMSSDSSQSVSAPIVDCVSPVSTLSCQVIDNEESNSGDHHSQFDIEATENKARRNISSKTVVAISNAGRRLRISLFVSPTSPSSLQNYFKVSSFACKLPTLSFSESLLDEYVSQNPNSVRNTQVYSDLNKEFKRIRYRDLNFSADVSTNTLVSLIATDLGETMNDFMIRRSPSSGFQNHKFIISAITSASNPLSFLLTIPKRLNEPAAAVTLFNLPSAHALISSAEIENSTHKSSQWTGLSSLSQTANIAKVRKTNVDGSHNKGQSGGTFCRSRFEKCSSRNLLATCAFSPTGGMIELVKVNALGTPSILAIPSALPGEPLFIAARTIAECAANCEKIVQTGDCPPSPILQATASELQILLQGAIRFSAVSTPLIEPRISLIDTHLASLNSSNHFVSSSCLERFEGRSRVGLVFGVLSQNVRVACRDFNRDSSNNDMGDLEFNLVECLRPYLHAAVCGAYLSLAVSLPQGWTEWEASFEKYSSIHRKACISRCEEILNALLMGFTRSDGMTHGCTNIQRIWCSNDIDHLRQEEVRKHQAIDLALLLFAIILEIDALSLKSGIIIGRESIVSSFTTNLNNNLFTESPSFKNLYSLHDAMFSGDFAVSSAIISSLSLFNSNILHALISSNSDQLIIQSSRMTTALLQAVGISSSILSISQTGQPLFNTSSASLNHHANITFRPLSDSNNNNSFSNSLSSTKSIPSDNARLLISDLPLSISPLPVPLHVPCLPLVSLIPDATSTSQRALLVNRISNFKLSKSYDGHDILMAESLIDAPAAAAMSRLLMSHLLTAKERMRSPLLRLQLARCSLLKVLSSSSFGTSNELVASDNVNFLDSLIVYDKKSKDYSKGLSDALSIYDNHSSNNNNNVKTMNLLTSHLSTLLPSSSSSVSLIGYPMIDDRCPECFENVFALANLGWQVWCCTGDRTNIHMGSIDMHTGRILARDVEDELELEDISNLLCLGCHRVSRRIIGIFHSAMRDFKNEEVHSLTEEKRKKINLAGVEGGVCGYCGGVLRLIGL